MAHTPSSAADIKNPGPFRISSGMNMLFIAFVVIGIASIAGGLMVDSKREWFSFVQNHFYFMSLGLGGLFFAAIQWLTGAMWSAPVRRVSEAFTSYLPVVLVTFLLLGIFGTHSLYIWTDASHVAGDLVLKGKSGYLSQNFFIIRNVIGILLWIFFARKMVGNSIAQDTDHKIVHTERNRVYAPIFLIIFALTFTMASFDQLMSLDPHWFSTMFGVYMFAGMFYANLASTCVLTIYLKRKGPLEGIVNDNHLHDLGKFMFAFTVFWAYIGFSQFMLIWYANQPEETMYFMHRFAGGWFYVSLFLLIGKFLVPFFLLLARDAKRNMNMLMGVGIFMMVAQWIDMLWIVQPEFDRSGPVIGWMELGTTLGFLGVFCLVVARFLAKHNTVAIGDPRLAESVLHHHQ